jgi:hypothetical protein
MNSDAKHIIVFTLGRDRESSFQWIDDGTYRRDKDMAFNRRRNYVMPRRPHKADARTQ